LPRTRGRCASLVLAAALALCAAGCGDDDEAPAADDPSSSASSESSAPSDTASASPSESTAAPSVTPAAGVELAEATSALNAPAGWRPMEAPLDYASAARGPGDYDALLLADRTSLASPDATHDSLADSWFDVAPKGAKAERLADVDLDGTPAYCIFYTVKGDPSLNYEIGTVRNGQSVNISFILDTKTLKQEPQLVDSVLASFRWVA
jgi:hypothetical protein